MNITSRTGWSSVVAVVLAAGVGDAAGEPASLVRPSTHNLLVEAKVSGNLAAYNKGLRGKPDHMIYDLRQRCFVRPSEWSEYGVGFGQNLGVVPEEKPAYWIAEWVNPVEANLMVLCGVYPNQPQPETGWKIELRHQGAWVTHARGVGGWYDRGRYVWGGLGTRPLVFDAIRVSVFSKDAVTPIESIHFRGEHGVSWVVAYLASFDARIRAPDRPVRVGEQARFAGEARMGKIESWRWEFGSGETAEGQTATHTFSEPGLQQVALVFSDGTHTVRTTTSIRVLSPIEGTIIPLKAPVLAGQPVAFRAGIAAGKATGFIWDFGDGRTARGREVSYSYAKAGIYKIKLSISDGKYDDECLAIIRVHTPRTLHIPQVLLDTDQKNEVDDQHYFAYGLFSQLDVLGINSIHHGGGQEPVNYQEILNVLDLAKRSGLPAHRVPFVFRGADVRLEAPESGRWQDTEPVVTAASEAILAAARGACPANPVWVLPVGPATNTASAILQARRAGLELRDRLKIMWLGGSNTSLNGEFNGDNDPWSAYIMTQSGLETWIMPAPVGGRIRMDVRKEADLYPGNLLGDYLERIVPKRDKALYDPSVLAAVISVRLGLKWVKRADPVSVAGPDRGYRWTKTGAHTIVHVITQIDQEAMKTDIFGTMKGKPTRLIGVAPRR